MRGVIMWTKSHSMITNQVTASQMWKLFADVDHWHTWDQGIEFAKLAGNFQKGNHFTLKPKGGPIFTVEIIETIPEKKFADLTRFPLAKMQIEHLFEETKSGLKITNTVSVTGMLSFLWIKLVAGNIANSFPIDMQHEIEAASKL